ncbi:D-alanyl-D-alanine carboxypeptidase [Candidatus Uhrbacteria bacterium]|nr:D-alanyl-D-alanine carboxypeptidase [Candidatus Uhrbacteria bacterium]
MKRHSLSVLAFSAILFFPFLSQAAPTEELRDVYHERPDLQAVFRDTDWRIRDTQTAKHDLTDLEDWAKKWGYGEYPERLRDYSPGSEYLACREVLKNIYNQRTDLQKIFDPSTWNIRPAADTHQLTDLEDWARKWGYGEYPSDLYFYSPDDIAEKDVPAPSDTDETADRTAPETTAGKIDPLSPLDLPGANGRGPTMKAGASFPFSLVTADSLLVADAASGEVLLSKNSLAQWPIASITKLMTAMVVLDSGIPLNRVMTLETQDEVGGARLRMDVGSRLTVQNLLYATLIGSANNTAHALARSTGLSIPEFVAEMNRKAEEIGLTETAFADPTGLELDNVSNAREVAVMLAYAMDNYHEIRRAASTSKQTVMSMDGEIRELEHTNKLLTDPNNGLYVLGGKTGYLIESQWNLALKVRDHRKRPVIAVIFGSDAQNWVFSETERAVTWVWDNYVWP